MHFQYCSTGLVYDDQNERCDVAENVEGRCGTLFVCPNPTGSYANIKSCTSYYQCTDSNPILMVQKKVLLHYYDLAYKAAAFTFI